MEELSEWVENSLVSLDQEETRERFDEIDEGFIILEKRNKIHIFGQIKME